MPTKRVVRVATVLLLGSSVLAACSTSNDDPAGVVAECSDGGATDAKAIDGGAIDGGTNDAPADSPAVRPDSAVDTGTTDAAATDGGTVDAAPTGPHPVKENLCAALDAMWPGTLTHVDLDDWPVQIILGPSVTPYTTGYNALLYADCNVASLIGAELNYTAWQTSLEAFEFELFGCPQAGVDAGVLGFQLVPSDIYGQPLTTADLQRLSDWFLEAVIQQVANQAAIQDQVNADGGTAPAILTGQQIVEIQGALLYYQSLYPNIIASPAFSSSMCVEADAGTDGG